MNSPDPHNSSGAGPSDSDEKRVVRDFAYQALREQRLARRWGILFKSLAFLYVFVLLGLMLSAGDIAEGISGEKHTALVELSGVISADSQSSADRIVTALRKAFENEDTAGVILRANSPGGSPVQSGYINDEIVRLREKYPDILVYAVVADVCASGCYYIAAAANEIYADKGSIVGSIGVRMDSFGFVDAMQKLGVERRLLTAGQSKGFLDPFLPLKNDEVQHVEGVLHEVHQQFINTVRRGRGDRLVEDPHLFSGLIWTGVQSLELGLVDALGSASYVAREVIGAEDIVDFTVREDYLSRLSRRFGAQVAERLAESLATQVGRFEIR
jgi:protease-4